MPWGRPVALVPPCLIWVPDIKLVFDLKEAEEFTRSVSQPETLQRFGTLSTHFRGDDFSTLSYQLPGLKSDSHSYVMIPLCWL